MPQTIQCRSHCLATLALNDLTTIVYNGASTGNNAAIKNDGPGNVWVSFDSGYPAAVDGANNFVLHKGETIGSVPFARGNDLTLMADAGGTVVNVIFGSG